MDRTGRLPSAVQDRAAALPFRDASFDVVLDRHEAYDPSDVARVLASGGVFLTQQVHGRSYAELNRALRGALLVDGAASIVAEGLVAAAGSP